MIRNLKALGLALGAVLALGALAASSASATDFVTTANSQPVLMTGTATHEGDVSDKFEMTGSGVDFTCTTSKFAATATNGATVVTADALYTGKITETPHGTPCNSTLGNVTVDMNACDYDLTGNTTGHDPVGTLDATVWITCGAEPIKITGPGATVSVPAQTPTTGGVTYTNLPNHPGGAAITVKSTVTGVTYTCAPAFFCGIAGIPSHGNDADYTGHVIVTCWEDIKGLPTPVTEGARVGCSMS